MRTKSRFFRFVGVVLALALIAAPGMAQVSKGDAEYGTYAQGKMDGERDAGGSFIWFVWGLLCGVLGVGAAYFMKPDPPTAVLVGRSSDYVQGYTQAYKDKGRDKNVTWACLGCLVSTGASVGGYYANK